MAQQHIHAQPKSTVVSPFSGQRSAATGTSFTDNRPEAVAQLNAQRTADNSPRVKQQPVVQLLSMSDDEMRGSGFVKYKAGSRWQYNYGNGIHISPIRNNSEINEFHVVLETKGKKRSRLDYVEGRHNDWRETTLRTTKIDEAHKPRKREMQEAGIYTVTALFQGTIAALPPLPVPRVAPAPATAVVPAPTVQTPAPTIPTLPTTVSTPVETPAPALSTASLIPTQEPTVPMSASAKRRARAKKLASA